MIPGFRSFSILLAINVLFGCASSSLAQGSDRPTVRVSIGDEKLGPPAQYGLDRLTRAIDAAGGRRDPEAKTEKNLVIGTYSGSKQIQAWVDGKGDDRIEMAKHPESLAVKYRDGKKTLVVAGYDDVGLMYALLEIADMVDHSAEPKRWFDQVAESSESPRNSMRRMRVLMHHAANEKDWYHSLEYWDWYIGMLGRKSVQRPEPRLLASDAVHGADVRLAREGRRIPQRACERRQRRRAPREPRGDAAHRQALPRSRHRAHDRRLAASAVVQFVREDAVESEVADRRPRREEHRRLHVRLALKKLLEECPGIARIQIRPNDESGIHPDDQTAFYRDSVMRAIKEVSPNVKLDLRTVDVL